MQFIIVGGQFRYELEKLCLAFLPFEKFEFLNGLSEIDPLKNRMVAVIEEKDNIALSVELKIEQALETRQNCLPKDSQKTDIERALAVLLFDCFLKITGYRSPWGILTGVRPAKLMGRLISQLGEEKAVTCFKNDLLVSDKKTKLCLDTYISKNILLKSPVPMLLVFIFRFLFALRDVHIVRLFLILLTRLKSLYRSMLNY